MKQLKRIAPLLLVLTLIIVLSSCVTRKDRDTIDPEEVSSTDLILVGRVSFKPSIVYDTELSSLDAFGNKIYSQAQATDPLIVFASHTDSSILNDGLGSSQSLPYVDFVRANKTFIVKTDTAEKLYLRGFGLVISDNFTMGLAQASKNSLVLAADFPLNFSIDVPRAARAIYLGNIIITRDENYLPVSYEIEDDFESANAQFSIDFPSYKLIPVELMDLEKRD